MTIDELAKHPWFSLPVASEEEMKKLFTARLKQLGKLAVGVPMQVDDDNNRGEEKDAVTRVY